MKKICVTGANGFIGNSICKILSDSGNIVRGFVRNFEPSLNSDKTEYISVGDISSKINWKDRLINFDYIIHCAGIAHMMDNNDKKNIYNLINFEATKHLAEQAAKANIKRLIFLSTIKVNGESTGIDQKDNQSKIFKHTDLASPKDPYAISKFKAEKALWEISEKTGLEIVVLRLPLVYGQGVKGNLMQLIKLIKIGVPLPFALIKNQRSMIGIDNLIDLLIKCIENPKAAGKTFLVSDGQDISTPDLINSISISIGRSSRLIPVPISLLQVLGKLFKRQNEIEKLIGSLQIDSSYVREILNWTPKINIKEGIKKMVKEI